VVDKIVLVDRGKIEFSYNKNEITIDALIKSMYEVAGHELPGEAGIGAGG